MGEMLIEEGFYVLRFSAAVWLLLNSTRNTWMILINTDTFREYLSYPFYPCAILRIGHA